MDYDLSVDLCGVELKRPWMNGSGIRSSVQELRELAPYVGALVTKTATLKPRIGNQTPTNVHPYLNAMALANPGYEAILREIEETDMLGVPVVFSFAAETEEEAATMAQAADRCGKVKIIQQNASCPNIRKGERKGIALCGDNDLMYRHVKAAAESTGKPLDVKLSPAFYIASRGFFIDNAGTARKAGARILSGINTVPGGMVIDIYTKMPVLASQDGTGGLGGPGIKPIGIGCIYCLREAFPDIPIVGGGGIYEDPALETVEYMAAGADAVSWGTLLADVDDKDGQTFFPREEQRLIDIMRELGVKRVSDLRRRKVA